MVSPSMIRVAVITNPPERRTRMILHRLRPRRQPVHVVPSSTRTGNKVRRKPERMLPVRRVPGGGVTVGHTDVIRRYERQDVGNDPGVARLARLARDGDKPRPRERAHLAGIA